MHVSVYVCIYLYIHIPITAAGGWLQKAAGRQWCHESPLGGKPSDNVLTGLCWPEPEGEQVATWSSQFLILQPAARASPGQRKPCSPFPHITSLQMCHGPGCTPSRDSAGEQASAGRRSWGYFNSRGSRVQAHSKNQRWGSQVYNHHPGGFLCFCPWKFGCTWEQPRLPPGACSAGGHESSPHAKQGSLLRWAVWPDLAEVTPRVQAQKKKCAFLGVAVGFGLGLLQRFDLHLENKKCTQLGISYLHLCCATWYSLSRLVSPLTALTLPHFLRRTPKRSHRGVFQAYFLRPWVDTHFFLLVPFVMQSPRTHM